MLFQRGKSYSQDLRERVFAAADEGDRVGEVARRLQVSVSYVSKALSRRRNGETTARAQRGHMAPKLAGLHAAIREQVSAHPDATLAELQAWLLAAHGVSASTALLCKTLGALALTRKKSRSGRPSRTAPTSSRRAASGASSSQPWSPAGWFSSMRLGPRPI
jgi:transposase